MTDPAARIDAMAAAWSAAALEWDAAALASLYADDALLFGGREGHAAGAAAIRSYFDSYDGVILSASLEMVDQEVRETGATTLFAQGFCNFSFTLAGGKRTRSRLRTSWLLDWSDGAATIRAHHFSPVPSAPPLGD